MKPYGLRDAGVASPVLRTLPGKVLSHWVFQGILGMDRTEMTFKVGFNTACISLAAYPPPRRLPIVARLTLAAFIGQWVGVLADGQLPCAAKWHGRARWDTDAVLDRLDRVAAGLLERPSVAVLAFGSASRGEPHAGSDIDVRVLRRSGLRNGVESCGWGRARASSGDRGLDSSPHLRVG